MRIVGRLLLAAAVVLSLGGAKVLDGGAFSLSYEHMSDAEARDLFERAKDGYAAVTRYLGLQPARKIVIRDLPADNPAFGQTRIVVLKGKSDAVRSIEIQIPVRYLRAKPFKTALVHEIAHAVAGNPFESNLFLAEGLATHVAGMLARADESDSFAKYPIHQVARRHLRQISVLNPLQHLYGERDIFADKEKKFASGYTSGLAYAFAGSFVTWLIQKDGAHREEESVAKFLEVYRTGDFTQVYGQGLPALERQWISFLSTNPAVRLRGEP